MVIIELLSKSSKFENTEKKKQHKNPYGHIRKPEAWSNLAYIWMGNNTLYQYIYIDK